MRGFALRVLVDIVCESFKTSLTVGHVGDSMESRHGGWLPKRDFNINCVPIQRNQESDTIKARAAARLPFAMLASRWRVCTQHTRTDDRKWVGEKSARDSTLTVGHVGESLKLWDRVDLELRAEARGVLIELQLAQVPLQILGYVGYIYI
jgi:hypothetical protein